jgi:hypothetical protein
MIEYQEETVSARGGGALRQSGVLWKTTEWLRLPLQPTTSNSAALLTWPVLKVSNFDQTIVNNLPRSAKAKEKPAELSSGLS